MKKQSKLDLLSEEQLAKLEKLVAAEKSRRRGKRPPGMSDKEFSRWLAGLAVTTEEKAE